MIGLGEALAMTDEASLPARRAACSMPRAGSDHPKALWYGSIAALQAGDLRKGVTVCNFCSLRIRRAAAQRAGTADPGPQSAAQRSGAGCCTCCHCRFRRRACCGIARSASPFRSHRVSVSSSRAGPCRSSSSRDPSAGGPPLAVQRHSSSDLPLTVELSERDAMIAARTIASVPRVRVVARLSRSGTPQHRAAITMARPSTIFEELRCRRQYLEHHDRPHRAVTTKISFGGLPSMVPAYARAVGQEAVRRAARNRHRTRRARARRVVLSAAHLQRYRDVCAVPAGAEVAAGLPASRRCRCTCSCSSSATFR